jgi:hypothetical protein
MPGGTNLSVLAGLRCRSQTPYPYDAYPRSDWDCDGEEDQAVILKEPSDQIAAVFSSGMMLTFETEVDGITPGKPDRHLTTAGKGERRWSRPESVHCELRIHQCRVLGEVILCTRR